MSFIVSFGQLHFLSRRPPDNEKFGQIKPEISVLSGFDPVTLTTIYQTCIGKPEETSKKQQVRDCLIEPRSRWSGVLLYLGLSYIQGKTVFTKMHYNIQKRMGLTMGRKGKQQRKTDTCNATSPNTVKESECEENKDILFEYALELAQEKYDFENQREQELIQQSGQMQSAFSFMTAALFMALPVALDHQGQLSNTFFFVAFSIILFFLFLSLVLASAATWRWKKNALGNIQQIKKSILDTDEWEKFLKKYNRCSSKINALEEVQMRKEELNNRRANLIHLSMIAFYFSIGSIVISYIVALVIIMR